MLTCGGGARGGCEENGVAWGSAEGSVRGGGS